MKRTHALLALLSSATFLLQGCGAEREGGAAPGLAVQASHAWGSYHWNTKTLAVVDSVTSEWQSYFDAAVADWNASVLTLNVEQGSELSRDRKRCRPISGKVRACNAAYGNNGWLGIAQIWVSGDHITQGTTKLNDTYFTSATYNTKGWRSLVACQEIGHDFGLGHQDEDFNNAPIDPHTCMDYFRPDADEQVGPNQHDYDQLASIYAHVTAGAAAPASTSAANADENWGRLVWTSKNGMGSTYVRDLDHGNRVITHVTWAP